MATSQLVDANLFNSQPAQPPGLRVDGFVQARIHLSQVSQEGEVGKFETDTSNGTAGILQTYTGPGGTFHQKFIYVPTWSPLVEYTTNSVVRDAGGNFWYAIAPVLGVAPVAPAWDAITLPGMSQIALGDSQATTALGLVSSYHQQGNGGNQLLGENVGLQFFTPLTGANAGSSQCDIMADDGLFIEPEHATGVGAGGSGQLAIYNKTGVPATSGQYKWFVPGATGGGLNQSHLQLFSYFQGAGSTYQGITELVDVAPLTPGAVGTPQTGGTLSTNWGFLDTRRAGTFTGTGVAGQTINVPSMTSASGVLVIPVAGPAFPAADPVITIISADVAANRGFSGTFDLNVVYKYLVIA